MKMKLYMVIVFITNFSLITPYHFFPFRVKKFEADDIPVYRERLLGGKIVTDSPHEFMIYIVVKLKKGLAQCGGALITEQFVVTAAHCLGDFSLHKKDIVLVSGKEDMTDYLIARFAVQFVKKVNETQLQLQEIRVKNVFIHPDYSSYTSHHDIALLQGEKKFSSLYAKPLPWSSSKLESKQLCTILGWGINPDTGIEFKMEIVENVSVSSVHLGCRVRNMGAFLCVNKPGVRICEGDSGSPMICQKEVWGVASHGVKAEVNSTCNQTVESYYTDVFSHRDWLSRVIENGQGSFSCSCNVIFLLPCFIFTIISVIFK